MEGKRAIDFGWAEVATVVALGASLVSLRWMRTLVLRAVGHTKTEVERPLHGTSDHDDCAVVHDAISEKILP